jgi:signal transduction histidine kinase
LCAIAALASVPQPTATAQQVVPIIEGALVGLALAVDGSVAQPLILYLVVPTLIAGLVGGPVVVMVTLLAEMGTMASVQVVRLQSGLLPTTFRLALPWLLTAVGIGLLGSWIRRLRADPNDDDRASYVAAHRLLDELRTVSRRLSSGLDPVVLSATLLDDCLNRVKDCRGAVVVRTDGGVFVSLAQRLDEGQADVEHDAVVLRCWMTAETVQEPATKGSFRPGSLQPRSGHEAASRTRWALPLRVGTRMVGVLVLDVRQPLDVALLVQLRELLDERALPLETALLFDEVRTLATVEERHRLAREIHDGIAQEIASLGYLVDDIAFAPDSVRVARVGQLRGELTRIVDDLRLSIFDLRSQVSRSTGLGSVLGDYLSEVGLRSGTAVHLTLDETPDRLRLEVEEQLLRIVQEAVTNARKHAGAANLWVTCHVRPPAAHLVVEDDGSGMHSTGRSEGFGMSIMRERAHRIGATINLSERIEGGTRVSVRLNTRADSSPFAKDEPPTVRPPWNPPHRPTEVAAHG